MLAETFFFRWFHTLTKKKTPPPGKPRRGSTLKLSFFKLREVIAPLSLKNPDQKLGQHASLFKFTLKVDYIVWEASDLWQ